MNWYVFAGIIAVVVTLLFLSIGRDLTNKAKEAPSKEPDKLTTGQSLQAIIQIALIILGLIAVYSGCSVLMK